MAETLKPGERLDDLQYQGLRIIQREDGFLSLIHISEPTRH